MHEYHFSHYPNVSVAQLKGVYHANQDGKVMDMTRVGDMCTKICSTEQPHRRTAFWFTGYIRKGSID